MLKQLRQNIVRNLWQTYCQDSHDIQRINAALEQKSLSHYTLDHFAIIDLPGPHSGIHQLSQIFSAIGYAEQGKDYLADKQNDFLWMAESDCTHQPASEVLPQVVVADFRMDELPVEVSQIIHKYSSQAQPSPLKEIQLLSQRVANGDAQAFAQCTNKILTYLAGRDWTLPTQKEFYTVREFNELLAWVLVFGRRPNHFTLSIHLLNHFTDLTHFHQFIENEVKLPLNQEGGTIKGGKEIGIAQGSTSGISQTISLSDGEISIPTGFIEFVWRYPRASVQHPKLWNDYFTGFVAKHADRVIESLYVPE